jgi:hypothetical protein
LGNCAVSLCVSPTGTAVELQAPDLTEPQPVRNSRNFRITDHDAIGSGSLRQKCRGNLDAIALLKVLENEQRPPEDDEKRILVRYVGWGGLPQVFDSYNGAWADERARLESLLTDDELESARATTLNAHYTAPLIIQGDVRVVATTVWVSTAVGCSNPPVRSRPFSSDSCRLKCTRTFADHRRRD